MTYDQWGDERMLEWLESGPSDVPVEPLEAAVAYARVHPRSRLASTGLWRFIMDRIPLAEVQPPGPHRRWNTALGAAVAVVVVAVVVVGGLGLMAGNTSNEAGGAGVPVASPTPVPTPAPTATPSPSSSLPAATSIASTCVVSTLAGKAGEFGAVDGTGAEARFSEEPGFLAWDGDVGVLYLADGGNHAIRRITPDGVVTTIAGKLGEGGNVDGTGPAARFLTPVGVSLWGGQLFIADSGNNTVRLITVSDGTVATVATGLSSPWSLAMRVGWASVVLIYVGETDGGAIRWFFPPGSGAPQGVVETLAGNPGNPNWSVDGSGFGWPFGMYAQAEDGNIYVVDVNQDRSSSALRLVNRKSGVTTTLPWDERYGRPGVPWAPAFFEADSDKLYLTTFLDNTVVRRDSDGRITLLAGSRGVEGSADGTGDVARFSGPMGIVGDNQGTLYVVDGFNGTIRTIRCP